MFRKIFPPKTARELIVGYTKLMVGVFAVITAVVIADVLFP
jgi:hypothetical protein